MSLWPTDMIGRRTASISLPQRTAKALVGGSRGVHCWGAAGRCRVDVLGIEKQRWVRLYVAAA